MSARIVGLSQIHPYWWPGHSLEWWTREDCDAKAVAFVERRGYRILASGIEGLAVPGGRAATHIIRIDDDDGVQDYLACLVDEQEGADAQAPPAPRPSRHTVMAAQPVRGCPTPAGATATRASADAPGAVIGAPASGSPQVVAGAGSVAAEVGTPSSARAHISLGVTAPTRRGPSAGGRPSVS